jgi:hypothetical protein
MTKLPHRRRIDPLPPPSGSFDRMLQTSRARRRRQGLAVLSSAAALVLVASGAFALGSSLNGVQNITTNAASEGNAAPGASTTKAKAKKHKKPRATATKTVKVSAPAVPPVAGAPASGNSVAPIIQLRGHVVDAAGDPIEGLYVQPGARNRVIFQSDGQIAARTDRNGNFAIPCPHAPVLVATWQLDHAVPSTAVGGAWGSAWVGPADATFPVVPSCGPKRVTTVVEPGSTLTGVVHTVGTCAPDQTFSLWVWLDRNREQTVRLSGLHDGETFTFLGLPAGNHTLGARGVTATLRFQPGVIVTHDATFSCLPGDSGSPSPTSPTPDPSSSPTDTTVPVPPGSTPTSTPLAHN